MLATRYGAFLMDVWMSSFRCEAAQVDYMSQLPIEIAIDIISSLSKFSDIAAVTSTCQHMRAIWLEHADIIYRRALKNTVEFETECRALLVDQGYARNYPTLSHLDVCRLVRNNRKASKSAERFGIEVASHVFGESFWFDNIISLGFFLTHRINLLVPHAQPSGRKVPGPLKHPPWLSRTERQRFLRAYYFVWRLVSTPAEAWPGRVRTLCIRDLYIVQEMWV